MLGFQNIHQFVFNLSQVTSALSSGSVRLSSKSTVKQKPENDVFCHESFLNSLSIFKQSENLNLFSNLPNVKFGPKFQDIQWVFAKDADLKFGTKISDKKNLKSFYSREKNNNLHALTSSLTWRKLKQFKNKEIKLLVQLKNDLNKESKNQWTNSFVSGKSFDENKKSSNCSDLGRFFKPVGNILKTSSSNVFITQKRWFRTKRWIEETKSRGFFPKPLKDEMNVADNPSIMKSNKYLDIMADEKLSAQEKMNLKVSFAEGYMVAANEYKKGGSNTFQKRFLSLTRFLSILAITLLIFYLLKLTGRKTLFPFNLGHHGEVDPEEVGVTFSDVKGVEEVKEELQEIVEFLRNPSKFSSMGGKLPRGVLLVGPPGTGKTLLARAVAGEANVPFFHASGSEFDEIFVGEGARRVRNLFKSAKAKSPAIVFIDEIDCVGSKRKSTMLHPYANQTINQLLSEMDGFAKNEGIIVLGATNRKSDLDPALLRPGRFDVEVLVPLPDLESRQQILKLYISKILSKDIDVENIAKATAGCTGADLEAMINHAAIRAASEGASYVTMEHIENAKDKIIMGPERKSAMKNDDANLMTAYHEGGHTLVAYFTEGAGILNKVTIVPRGESLGHTAVIPEDDFHHVTKAMCLARIDVVLGGRAAEELVYGVNNITINASDDLDKATKLATAMVKKYGMSEKIGLRTLKSSEGEFVSVNEFGQSVSDQVDSEVKRLIHESYERAKKILKEHAKEHKILAEALVKYKTLSPEDVRAILGEKPTDKGLTAKAALS